VDKDKLIDNSRVRAGDAILALASSGVHSNGFSLVRKLIPMERTKLHEYSAELGKTFGEELLTPTNIYVKPVLALIDAVGVHSIAHITGGGFIENIPRSIPKGLTAQIEKHAVRVLPIFRLLQAFGELEETHMFNTFNMGVGMTIALPQADVDRAISLLHGFGVSSYVIGEVTAGDEGVSLC
jgi:phosphoribosylformylglycinamidine cyclo-ligase